jgi:hypothetical protein
MPRLLTFRPVYSPGGMRCFDLEKRLVYDYMVGSTKTWPVDGLNIACSTRHVY